MDAKKIAVLVLVPLLIFALSVGLFLLLWPAGPQPQPIGPSAYTLRENAGKLALYKGSESAPVARYDIYTNLLPADDVTALQQGIPIEDQAALRRYLEDFGG